MTTTILPLLHDLQRRGFTPHENGCWFDLDICRHGVLDMPRARVRAVPDDGAVVVHVLTGNNICLWTAELSHGTPPNVTAAVIDLAIAYAVTMGADECDT